MLSRSMATPTTAACAASKSGGMFGGVMVT